MRTVQDNFNAGVWSPLLEGRTTLEKFSNSLYRAENMVIDPRGPLRMAPGFQYIAGTKTNASRSALIPFVFSATDTFILEFGNLYIRFYTSQAQVMSGGNPYEIVSPYAAADVDDIWYFQSGDIVYLLHESYAPRKLARGSATSWTLSTINFMPGPLSEQGDQPNATLTPGATTGTGITFTAGSSVFLSGDVGRVLSSGTGRASITQFTSGTQVICDIIDDFASTSAIAANNWTLNGSPYGNVDLSAISPVGSIVSLTGVDGSEAVSNLLGVDTNYWIVSASGTNEYYLDNTAATYQASEPDKFYIIGVEAIKGVVGSLGVNQWGWGDNDTLGYNTLYVRLSTGVDPDTNSTTGNENEDYLQSSVVSGTKDLFRSTDVGKYVKIFDGLIKLTVYSSSILVYGELIREATANSTTTAWYLVEDDWSSANGYPSCGEFYEQRMVLAGSTAFPDTVWGSQTGDYENFAQGSNDADSWVYTLGRGTVNKILWVAPREFLMLGTEGGEWRMSSGVADSPITPTAVKARQERGYGSKKLKPVTTDGATLFVQRIGKRIRELTFRWEQDAYSAPDLTILAENLTSDGIAGMVLQQEPFNMIWTWLDDGSLLALTYLRDQDVVGWQTFPDRGIVESMAVIPGDEQDEVWAIIRRTVNGSTVRYVELMAPLYEDDEDTFVANLGANAKFLDSMITYSGASTTTITGLDHLEGEDVYALVGGGVATGLTVASGQVTIPVATTVCHVGIPYTATTQLQRIEALLRDGTTKGRFKKADRLFIQVLNSGAFKAGPDENTLTPVIDRTKEITIGGPATLSTGDLECGIDGGWKKATRPMIVQDLPLPLTIISVTADVELG